MTPAKPISRLNCRAFCDVTCNKARLTGRCTSPFLSHLWFFFFFFAYALHLNSVHLRTRSDLNLKRVSTLPVGLKHWPCLFSAVHERSATSARFICLLVLLLKSENDFNSTALSIFWFLFFLTPNLPPITCHYNMDIGALLHRWPCQIPVEAVMHVKLSINVLQQFLIVLRFFLNCTWGLDLKAYHIIYTQNDNEQMLWFQLKWKAYSMWKFLKVHFSATTVLPL